MNPRLMRPPPPREIQAHFGSKGRTHDTPQSSSTADTSDASSVVSDVTLDAAFGKDLSTKQQSDACFHNHVVVAKSPTRRTTATISTIDKQESLSKLDGTDFLDGKFKNAFHKEITIALKNDDNESQGKMSEEKQATAQLNHHRQIGEGGNSVLDMLTSPNLVEKKKERHKRPKSTDRKKNGKGQDEDSRARLPRIDEFHVDRANEGPAKEISIHPEHRDPKKESPNKGRPAKQHVLPQQMLRRDIGDIPESITISDDVIEDIDFCGLDVFDFIEEKVQAEKEEGQNPVDAEVKEAHQSRVDSSSRRSESSLRKQQKTTRSKTASPTCRRQTTPSRNRRETSASPTRRRRTTSRDLRRNRSEFSASPTRRRRKSSSPSRKSRRDRSAPASRTRRKSASSSFVHSSTQKKSSSKIEKREKKSSHFSKDGSFALSKSEASENTKSRRLESIKRENDTSHLLEINEKDQVVTKRSMEMQGPSIKKNPLKTMKNPEFVEIPRHPHIRVSPKQALNVKRPNNRLQMREQDSEFEEIMRVANGSCALRNSSSAPDLALQNVTGQPEKTHDLSPKAASVNSADMRVTPLSALMKRMSWRNGWSRGGSLRPTPLSEEIADLSRRSASTFTSSTSDVSWLQGSKGMRSYASSIGSHLSSELSSKSCGSSGRSFTESPGKGGATMPRRVQGECASPVVTAPKTKRHYTPTVITNDSNINLSYSERVLQGQIGMPGTRALLKPTPEGSTLCEF